MGIASGAQQGIEVDTAAMDESLGSQTQQTGNNTIVVSDTLANAGNGNITAPTGYVGRLCILRQGESDEETRRIIGEIAGSGNTRILTVPEDWVSVPVVTTDTIHVSYSSDDMEAFNGMTLNSRTGVYEGGGSREWQIGLGTNFAYVAVFDYQGWESTDRGTTEPGITVRNNGRLDFGYIENESPIQGAIVTSTNNGPDEDQIEIEAGGIMRVYASIFRSWLFPVSMILRATADVISENWTVKDYTNDFLLLAGTHKNLTIAGKGGSEETIILAEEVTINGLVLAATAGFATEDTTTETITVRDATFINNLINILVDSNKTWNIINPSWTIDEATFDDLSFVTATANEVNEKYSLDPEIQDSSRTAIVGARVFIYEGLRLDDLVQELTSDANGLAPGSWVYKKFTDAESGGGEISTITTNAATPGLNGDYFTLSQPSGDFYVWYFDGRTSNDPAPGGTGIQVTYNAFLPEVSDIECVADVTSSLNGTYFTIDTPSTSFYVWYDDGVSTTDPAPGGTGIQVTYVINDTANQIAALTNTAIDGTTGFGSSVVTATVTVTNDTAGPAADTSDNDTGFTIDTVFQGTNNDSADQVATVTDAAIDAVGGFGSSLSTNVVTVTNDTSGPVTDIADGSPATGFSFLVTTQGAGSSLTVLTDGNHAIRVDNYGDFPFVASAVSTAPIIGALILNPDPAISEPVQATAITNGSGVVFNTDANASSIIKFTGGANTLNVGETVTGGSSGADGIVTEILDGDSIAGTVHLKTRDGVSFTGTESLSSSGSWTGTLTASSEQRFSRWIEGDGKTLQVIHDYFAARTAEDSGGFTAEAEVIHEWGKENEGRVLFLGINGFFTNRSASEGIIVINHGAGIVEKFTDDAGGVFVPPVSVTVTFDGMFDNSEVRVYLTGTSTELAGIENATAGSQDDRNFPASLSSGTVVDYTIVNITYEIIRKENFTWPSTDQTIDIGAQQRLDRNFLNP